MFKDIAVSIMKSIESDRLLSYGSFFDKYGDEQYSSSNAWNVNFNNGNVNNNNRTNTNYVRPFAESRLESIDDFVVPFYTFIDAYLKCRKNKRTKQTSVQFEMNWSNNIYKLWREIAENRYEIGNSICFIVNKPVKREVFAASFRDRIVHYWIAERIEPLFEEYLPDVMCSNRNNHGTLKAVNLLYDAINDGQEGVIYKFDIQGFFMSIDKRILYQKLDAFISERYDKPDLNHLLSLVKTVVMHCPQNKCTLRSPKSKWNGLARNKSLFNQDEYHGIAIGNLTSQMFANFYLCDVVLSLIEAGVKGIVQYVDDICIKIESENNRKQIQSIIDMELQKLSLRIHPKKRYIQPSNHGVSFIGSKICKGRIYPGGRSVDRFMAKMRYFCSMNDSDKHDNLDAFCSSINSYLGLFRMSEHYRTFTLRKNIAMYTLKSYSDYGYIVNNEKFVLKKKYNYHRIMEERIRNYNY